MSHQESRLPKVNSRAEFMNCLSTMIIPPKEETDDEEARGRLRELKTYIIETNDTFPNEIITDGFTAAVENTGVEDLKILYVLDQNRNLSSSFFVDLADRRFISLYTNSKANHTHKFNSQLSRAHKYTFDRAWFSTGMLKKVSDSFGNKFDGVGVNYKDVFATDDFDPERNDSLNLDVSGGHLASKALGLITGDEEIKRKIAYNKVRIIRGSESTIMDFVEDDVTFEGVFAVKSGKSVTDHVELIEMVKGNYRDQMKIVEDNSLGVKQVNDRTLVEGKAFDFEFNRSISDWNRFLNKMFDSTSPFQLWGLKEKVYDGYTRVLAVDLHTGHPFDVEVANNLIRVYLPQGSCGNAVLRLFVNLQQYFDSTIYCKELV